MPRPAREVPWLEKLDRVFYVFWYERTSKRTRRLSLRTMSPPEATLRYIDFLRGGASSANEPLGLKVRQVLDDYEREHVNGVVIRNGREEPRMVAANRTAMCLNHLRRHLGSRLVQSLDAAACEEYLIARRGDRGQRRGSVTSDSTVRREISILSAAINHSVKRGRLEFSTRKLLLPPASDPKERWLTYEELARLRMTATGNRGDRAVAAFIEISYYTASRAEAVMLLEPFQVNLPANQIALDKPGAVKTKKRRPLVPIDDALRPTIERLLLEAKRDGRKYLVPEVGRRSDRRILEAFKRIARLADLHDVTPHTLRHTRATHLLQAGASIWEVAKLLGDTAQTVDRVYGHHCTEAVARALRDYGRKPDGAE